MLFILLSSSIYKSILPSFLFLINFVFFLISKKFGLTSNFFLYLEKDFDFNILNFL